MTQFTFPNGTWLALQCPETTWVVIAQNTDRGLRVGPAFLRREPGSPFIPILKTAHIAENFTVYHDGVFRLSDTEHCTALLCIPTLRAEDLGPGGMLITFTEMNPYPLDPKPTAAAELRDRGLAWMCKDEPSAKSHSRRGMEMSLWGMWDTGNYDYILQYTFRDDGQMSFRVGATGYNNGTPGTHVAHMHDVLWRIDIELGSGLNTAQIWTHNETTLTAFDAESPFNNGREGAVDIDPLRFASLVVSDQTENDAGSRIGYEVQTLAAGIARHYAANEGWTLHDTWVTRYAPEEEAATLGTGALWASPATYLLGNAVNKYGVFDQEPIDDQDIVIWQLTSAHHEPHDEDRAKANLGPDFAGLTLMHWSGFDLVPHNFFANNPLGGPHRSLCGG